MLSAMIDRTDFAFAWKDYRRRRRWFFGVWLGGFLVVVLLVKLLSTLSLDDLAFYILGPAWMIGFLIAGMRMWLFQCPRCHRRFFCTWWHGNLFARKCLHCGLPKWSESDVNEK